jgi:hypothetical protein
MKSIVESQTKLVNNSPSPSEKFLTKRKSKRTETLGGIIQNPSQSPKSDN